MENINEKNVFLQEYEGEYSPEFEEAKKDVTKMLQIAIEAFGLDIDTIPEIIPVKDSKLTCYHLTLNIIGINPSSINDGIGYAEEIMHYVRRQKCTNLVDDEATQRVIDEFYGRLGEEWFREKTKETELERLFHKPPRNFSRPEIFYKEELKQAKLNNQSGIEFVISTLIDTIHEKFKALLKDLKEKKIDANDAKKQAIKLFGELIKRINEYPKELLPKLSKLECILNSLKLVIMDLELVAKDPENLRMEDIEEDFEGVNQNIESFKREDYERVIKLAQRIDHVHTNTHYVGYMAAELLINSDQNFMDKFSDLLSLNGEEVIEKYLAREEIAKIIEDAKEKAKKHYN